MQFPDGQARFKWDEHAKEQVDRVLFIGILNRTIIFKSLTGFKWKCNHLKTYSSSTDSASALYHCLETSTALFSCMFLSGALTVTRRTEVLVYHRGPRTALLAFEHSQSQTPSAAQLSPPRHTTIMNSNNGNNIKMEEKHL